MATLTIVCNNCKGTGTKVGMDFNNPLTTQMVDPLVADDFIISVPQIPTYMKPGSGVTPCAKCSGTGEYEV